MVEGAGDTGGEGGFNLEAQSRGFRAHFGVRLVSLFVRLDFRFSQVECQAEGAKSALPISALRAAGKRHVAGCLMSVFDLKMFLDRRTSYFKLETLPATRRCQILMRSAPMLSPGESAV